MEELDDIFQGLGIEIELKKEDVKLLQNITKAP